MTRSGHKGSPRRAAIIKFVRQKAHKEGILFKAALEKTILPAGIKVGYSSEHQDRRQGRTGMQWNSSDFINNVEDGDFFIHEEDVFEFRLADDTFETPHHTDMKVSLLDIARPAKQKGAAKDFEVVQKVRNVIALEDNDLEYQWEDDEWELIYDERHAEEKRSYSSTLRGNET
jgi:hypothetical protein